MRLAVIADDITGASDCGGQLIHYGLDVSVILKNNFKSLGNRDAVIFNTDSRSISENEAYEKVKDICERVKEESFDVVYKKIDSTMRGNIGQEINAVYDVFHPDFVFIAPAFPKTGRQVIDGIHFLNGKQLHETEVAKDPKTPVTDSQIARLIQKQAKREVGHLSYKDLEKGYESVLNCLENFKLNNIKYITVDSVNESHLECLASMVNKTNFSIIWVGSAGLMNYLPQAYGLERKSSVASVPPTGEPVLLVVGSVSAIGRKQLEQLLLDPSVVGLEMKSTEVILDNEGRTQELNRLKKEAVEAFSQKKNIALFSSNEVIEAQKIGQENGYNTIQVSNIIAKLLGELSLELINYLDIQYLFLTGGDTAYQVLEQLQTNEFHLFDEVEPGIPVGIINSRKEIYAVTKAGNFGTKLAMINALRKLQGGI